MKRFGVFVLLALGVMVSFAPVAGQQQPDPFAGSYVPGEMIVKFARGVSSVRRTAMMAARSATIARRFQEVDLDHVRLPANRTVEAAIAELRNNPEVEYAQPNYVYRAVAPGPPNDPFWLDNTLWGMLKIQAQPAWQTFGGGNGSVIVGDIDTGVKYDHPDLAVNMWRNPAEIPGNNVDDDLNGYVDDVFGIDAVNHDSDPMDDNSHGTHTAGTIAGVGNNGVGVVGVNWNAKILACKFLNAAGSGSDAGAIECFNYLLTQKQRGQNIRVSSNSWGSYRGSGISTALKDAVDAAGAAGILNVFAAGNDNSNNDNVKFDPASFPSSSIVSVAASDQNDNKAGFSNFGVADVDLAAPGVSIYSSVITGTLYGFKSGTSMATPHVAGAAAFLSSLDPTLTVDNLKVVLMQNVDVLPQWAGLVASGGRLNLFKAASSLGPPVPIDVTFLGADSSTQGNWQNAYGSDGYLIVNDATSLPAYATVTPTGHSSYTWASATTDPRALRRAGTGRIAATWYAGSAFNIDVDVSGAQPHEIALYCVDWDSPVRSQRIDILRPSNGVVLDSRTISGFNGGQYLRWSVSGHVLIRVTKLAGSNSVVSGLFFGGASPPPNQPPTVSLTSPVAGATFTPGSPILITADAADDGTVNSVAFYGDGQLLGTDSSSPYSFNWTNAATGPHTLTAVATDNALQQTTSAPVNITVAVASSASAVFVGTDATTLGDWSNQYGADGFSIVDDATSLPAYATLTTSGASSFTWAASTTQVRALRRASGTGRVAAAWYAKGQFDITVGLTDGQPHKVALYCLDFDSVARSQRLDVFDANTNVLLDTRTISNFSGGQYLVWTITGTVRVHVTRLAGSNAVVSGVFFGAGSIPANQPPIVSITSPASGASFAPGAPIPIAADASDPDGSVSGVAFYADGQLLGTDTSAPYSFNWTNASNGPHTLAAVATDNSNQPTTSAPVPVTVTPSANTGAVFVGVDSTTQGDWLGVYGADGFSIVDDATSLPAYAAMTQTAQGSWTWNASTIELQALRRASGPGRIAAAWFSKPPFDINIAFNDGQAHRVALYCLDYDSVLRSQRIDIFDAVSNALLDSRTISNFSGGRYLVWTITGNVRVRVTKLTGSNAVVSGVFFGG